MSERKKIPKLLVLTPSGRLGAVVGRTILGPEIAMPEDLGYSPMGFNIAFRVNYARGDIKTMEKKPELRPFLEDRTRRFIETYEPMISGLPEEEDLKRDFNFLKKKLAPPRTRKKSTSSTSSRQ